MDDSGSVHLNDDSFREISNLLKEIAAVIMVEFERFGEDRVTEMMNVRLNNIVRLVHDGKQMTVAVGHLFSVFLL